MEPHSPEGSLPNNESPEGIEMVVSKKGTNIIAPVENSKAFTLVSKETPDAEPKFRGVVLKFEGPDKNIYSLRMESTDQIAPTAFLTDAPSMVKIGASEYAQTSQEGKLVPFGMPILETTRDNATIKMTNEVQILRTELEPPAANPNFLKDSSGKIIIPVNPAASK